MGDFMAETFLCIFGMVLCVCGAVGIIHWTALKLSTGGETKRVYAILLKNEADIQLQMLIDTLQWDSSFRYAKIYAVDGGLSDEMAEYCQSVCKSHRIIFLGKDKASDIIDLF